MPGTKSKLKVGVIIQSRMGSARLPGKVLMDIAGKPMLWHIIERLKYAKKINEIIIAIPNTSENDVLEKFAKKYNLKYYRGSENDVLERYFNAAKKFKCDIVVRITSDCPLIDPIIVDKIIEKHLISKADFTANYIEGEKGKPVKRTFPRGLDAEVLNFLILEKINRLADKDYQREHVTSYIFDHPEEFSLSFVENEEDFSDMRWTVDEKKDLQFIKEVYKKLYSSKKMFYMEDVLSLLEEHPELAEINRKVKQKLI